MTERNRSGVWKIAAGVLGAIILFPLLFGGGMMGAGGFGMLGGGMFLVPILLIVLVVYLVSESGNDTGSRSSPNAMETLQKRYARGEIDEEEFEQRKRILRSNR